MYAIIRTGGKQYKVEAGDEILVEKLDAEVGAEVAFEVLMLCGDEVVVGKPVVEGVTAKATVVDQVNQGQDRVHRLKHDAGNAYSRQIRSYRL